MRGGLKEGFVKISPYGPAVSAEAKKKADEAKAKIMAGTLVIFKGPLKDNTGKTVIAAGPSRRRPTSRWRDGLSRRRSDRESPLKTLAPQGTRPWELASA